MSRKHSNSNADRNRAIRSRYSDEALAYREKMTFCFGECAALITSSSPWLSAWPPRPAPRTAPAVHRHRLRAGLHFGEHLVEQRGFARIDLGRGRYFVTVIVVVVAGAAADFGGIAAHHRNHGVVHDALALYAEVVDYVSQADFTHPTLRRARSVEVYPIAGAAGGGRLEVWHPGPARPVEAPTPRLRSRCTCRSADRRYRFRADRRRRAAARSTRIWSQAAYSLAASIWPHSS